MTVYRKSTKASRKNIVESAIANTPSSLHASLDRTRRARLRVRDGSIGAVSCHLAGEPTLRFFAHRASAMQHRLAAAASARAAIGASPSPVAASAFAGIWRIRASSVPLSSGTLPGCCAPSLEGLPPEADPRRKARLRHRPTGECRRADRCPGRLRPRLVRRFRKAEYGVGRRSAVACDAYRVRQNARLEQQRVFQRQEGRAQVEDLLVGGEGRNLVMRAGEACQLRRAQCDLASRFTGPLDGFAAIL